jgi:hypothetical protein
MLSAKMLYRIACIGLSLCVWAQISAAQPSVTISPATVTINPGETVTLSVIANNISPSQLLHAANVTVTFNNAVVQLTSSAVGGFLSSAGGQVWSSALPSSNALTFDQAILGGSTDVSGTGTLFTMTFAGVAAGVSAISVTNVDLRQFIPPDGQVVISATSTGGSVTVRPTVVNIKAFLQGPYSSGSMTTALRTAGVIPLTQPYTGSPWAYPGTEAVASIPASIVDWVLVELRTGTSSATKVATRAAFVKSDGTVVDLDGSSSVAFPASVVPGNYFIVLRHRNHLAAMSAAAVALNTSSAQYDFTGGLDKYYIGDAALLASGIYGLYAGDADAGGTVGALDRSATWNDRNLTGYRLSDVDLSGKVGALDRSTTWNNRNKVSNAQ